MRYTINLHLAMGVVVTFKTNDEVDYNKILENETGVIRVSGTTNKTQYIPVRKVVVVEVVDEAWVEKNMESGLPTKKQPTSKSKPEAKKKPKT